MKPDCCWVHPASRTQLTTAKTRKNKDDGDEDRNLEDKKASDDSANSSDNKEEESEEDNTKDAGGKRKKTKKKKGEPEPKIKWKNKSKAKILSHEDMQEGRVPTEAKCANGNRTALLKEIHKLRPEFAPRHCRKISSRLGLLPKRIKDQNNHASQA